MELYEAISLFDRRKVNTITRPEKIRWLSVLDGLTYETVLRTHADPGTFTPYTDQTATNTTLLIPAPHDEVYLWWMEAMSYYLYGEYVRYNNAMELFRTAFRRFADDYHRSHSPVSKVQAFY